MSKRLILLTLLALLLGGLLVWLMQSDSGYVLIAFKNYTLEMSLWALLLVLIVVWLIIRSVRWVFGKAGSAGKSLANRDWFDKRAKSRRRMGNGLLQLVEGRWEPAKKNLETSAPYSDMPLLNLLGAATAAFELGDKAESDRLLAEAEKATDSSQAADLVKARLLLKQGSFPAAEIILEKLHRKSSDSKLLLGMLKQCYLGDKNWEKLNGLIPDLKRFKVNSKEEIQQLQILITVNMLRINSVKQGKQPADYFSAYKDHWNELPRWLRKNPAVIKAHMQCLFQFGEHLEVDKTLRKLLPNQWDDELVTLYGLLETGNHEEQLLVAESWLDQHSDSLPLLLSLSRLSQKAKLWGKARDYLEQALKLEKRTDIYLELAQLSSQLGEGKYADYLNKSLMAIRKANSPGLTLV